MFVRYAFAMSILATGSFVSSACAQQEIPRTLAPGVLKVIPVSPQEDETADGPIPLVELLTNYSGRDWKPNYIPKKETLLERARQVTLRRPIWNLEFAFKPIRRIWVDIPSTTGKMQQKQIWYMVYRVKNPGTQFVPSGAKDVFGNETFKVVSAPGSELHFVPHFVFAGQAMIDDKYVEKEYFDRIIPLAAKGIQARESRGVKLYNSVEIANIPIPVSDENSDRSVWGYVSWEDLDPRIDFFRIYVQGLTNAIQFFDPDENGYQKGNPPASARQYSMKTLQLNFWRAGDSINEHEDEVHSGVRLEKDPDEQASIFAHYGITEPLDHLWLYR